MVPQRQHAWHCGPDKLLWELSYALTVRCSAASLAFGCQKHQLPHIHKCNNPKCLQILPNTPWGESGEEGHTKFYRLRTTRVEKYSEFKVTEPGYGSLSQILKVEKELWEGEANTAGYPARSQGCRTAWNHHSGHSLSKFPGPGKNVKIKTWLHKYIDKQKKCWHSFQND